MAVNHLGDKPSSPATPYVNYEAFLLKANRIDEAQKMLVRAVELMPEKLAGPFRIWRSSTASLEDASRHCASFGASLRCERMKEESRRGKFADLDLFA